MLVNIITLTHLLLTFGVIALLDTIAVIGLTQR